MHRSSVARAALLCGAAGLTLSLVAVPAHAQPVFVDADTTLSNTATALVSGSGCSYGTTTYQPNTSVPVVENGGAASITSSVSGTMNGPTAGDTVTFSSQTSATGTVTSTGGVLQAITLVVTGQTATSSLLATSACSLDQYAQADLDYAFALDRSGFLTVQLDNGPHSYAGVELTRDGILGTAVYVNDRSFDIGTHRRLRVPVTPGSYYGRLTGAVGTSGVATTLTASDTSTMRAVFTALGARLTPVTGKATAYVDLPATATCGTGSVSATITSKKARVARLTSVKVFVDDRLTAKTKHPKKGRALTVPLVTREPSEVRVEAVLRPAGKHARPKTVTATTSYEACS